MEKFLILTIFSYDFWSRNAQVTYARFCVKVVVLNRSYSTNMQPIRKRFYPTGAWEFITVEKLNKDSFYKTLTHQFKHLIE